MYMSIKTLDYVIFSHQANLSKTTKHWDGFVSHCSMCCDLLVTNLLLTLDFMVIAGFSIPRTGVAKVAINSMKAFQSLVMWEVVPESRYQSDLELPSIAAVAIYVRLFRLDFPSSA